MTNSSKPMRMAFGEALRDLAEEFPDLVVLDADCSSSTQTKLFASKYPERFFNFGIAEANMVSAAAGMAASGLVPVVSSFAFLLALRAGDQVNSLISYNNLNVKLAGGYAGLSDYADGASHQSVSDIAIMRAMPNMTVIAPSDLSETRSAVRAMLGHKGPVYLRLSREAVPDRISGDSGFEIGRGHIVREGGDVAIISTGAMLRNAMEAAELLAGEGISALVAKMPTVKPLDNTLLFECASRTSAIVSIEEHSLIGGLGSAIAETLCENRKTIPFRRCGIPDRFGESGEYGEILQRAGLDSKSIADAVRLLLRDI
jgi:transketolase